MPCRDQSVRDTHNGCYAKHWNSACGGALAHYVRDQYDDCYVWCETHAKHQGYIKAGGSICNGWSIKPLPGLASALTPKATAALGPEPPCSCPMFVGACVSVGHRADCAYVKWNQARLAAKATGVSPPAATTTGIKPLCKDGGCTLTGFRFPKGQESTGFACTACLRYSCSLCAGKTTRCDQDKLQGRDARVEFGVDPNTPLRCGHPLPFSLEKK